MSASQPPGGPALFRREVLDAQERAANPGEPLRAGGRGGPLGRLMRRIRGVRVPYVPQMEISDCGAACLAMTLALHGKHVPLEEVRVVTGTDREGVDALAITRAARHFGLRARGLRLEPGALPLIEPGAILHWDLNHFVVLESATESSAVVVDPAGGRRRVSPAELDRSFTGIAIELEPDETFAPARGDRRSILRHLMPVLSRRGLLVSVLLSSALIQVFALALPLLTAIVVDRVVPHRDQSLLLVVSLALMVMVLFNLLTSYLRGRQLLSLRTRVDVEISLRFLEHLAALPYSFFLSRSTGDLMMRLNSNSTVREILTSSVLSGILDGGAALLYLGIICFSSPTLGLLVALVAAAQVAVLVASRARYQRLMAENLQAQARSQGYLGQFLAGIETLKVSGTEERAVEHWSNLFVREINVSVDRGKLSALVDALLSGLRVGGPVVILSWGALQVLGGHLTLGTMLALSALATGFLGPLASLVGNGLQLQSLGSYLARINDVLDTPREQEGRGVRPAPRFEGGIAVEDVSFRYGPLAGDVLSDVSLDVRPGQMVAIVGPSGSGKSTLGNLILGLYPPTAGHVRFDGVDLLELEARSVRHQVGVVPQVPYLFGGSIRDNIAIASPSATLTEVREAARLACIADDIEAMALGYDTVLSDGGTSLSGGQRQRIALARALVRQPAILLLDEATSELDSINEARILANIEALRCTRIVIAHRLSTIAGADQIVVLDGGQVTQRGRHAGLVRRRGLYRDLVRLQGGAA